MIPTHSIKYQQYQALLNLLPEHHHEYPQIMEQFRMIDVGETSEDNLESSSDKQMFLR
ncbi:hypothetical protein JCM21714_1568 [Gracilibacillus boraciitolerans JCM 21714]|uniref:Uncharacterized protein n=1 Tax=Gracilibacillus boraciitolerans JCM 21714 TaxID=1298598 RepID=W4VHD3_9BACI|nr:hypothetical protein [Gracilibacillus boraciitolerans]GAE92561.1 hypothetical protein JCM21714_1568 [Gracilibacillus boraciitolerans JCM 21714]